jgi:hypothetical protein
MALPSPVIIVPGITATCLRDGYPVSPETVWPLTTKEYERIALHPDNIRYDAIEPSRVASDQMFEVAYGDLVKDLWYQKRWGRKAMGPGLES